VSKKLLLILVPLFLIAIAAIVFAQQNLGCCCDPVVRTGSIMSQSVCISPFIFVPFPSSGFTGCNALCNATALPPSGVSPPSAVGCGAPGYNPAVSNLAVSPVKGKKEVSITFNVPCPADNVKIYRCKGSSCTNFSLIATLGQVNKYVDSSKQLLWDTDYTYQVIAKYKLSNFSFPVSSSVNTGDLECWHQTTSDLFCISAFYYDQFKNYLQSNGYKITSAADFQSNYVSERDAAFNSFFGKSWFCNAANKLSSPAPQVSCVNDEICVSDGSVARCVEPSDCSVGGDLGLFASASSCEGSAGSRNYCFLDVSSSIVDKCYECDPKMSCYDYHSRDACLKDKCGVGQCNWVDVFSELGVGVCYDDRFDSCSLCQAKPSSSAKNKEGFNYVFNSCSPEKAAALSTVGTPCFFNKNTEKGESCDYVDCTSYTQSQCRSPSGGVKLNSDNSVLSKSTDPCGIGVCQYSVETGCVKNANGASGVGWQDCYGALNSSACEKDYFPPDTLVALTGLAPGKHDFIDFIINDKTSKEGPVKEAQGVQGYKTYLCIMKSNSSCSQASSFPIVTSSSRLFVNDLALQDGQNTIGLLSQGNNKILYYSVDPNKNVEVVKSFELFACDKCSGPKAVNVTVVNARKVKDKYYTNSLYPEFIVSFNEPAQVTASSLDKAGVLASMSRTPSSGANYDYTFKLNAPLSEGKYIFSVNAKDDNDVSMDAPIILTLIVDTTPPSVVIKPDDGSEFDKTDVPVALNFSEKIDLRSTSLDEIIFVDEFARKALPILLSKELTTENDRFFSGVVSNLKPGLKVVNVRAADYAGNFARKKSYFSVFTGAPAIRMVSPSWGKTSVYSFNVTVETSNKAKCKYLYDVESPPPANQFDSGALIDFDSSDGILHTIRQVSIPYDDMSEHVLSVYCKSQDFDAVLQNFRLSMDLTEPSIVSAYANPDPVVEPYLVNGGFYSTRLQVQSNEEGFCRYSNSTQDFNKMEGVFPGYDELPKKSHSVLINVSSVKSYTYFVACKDKAGLVSPVEQITFDVDLSVPFSIKSTTETFSKTEVFSLGIESNKRSYCYFGESPGDITTCLGACDFTNGHSQQIKKPIGLYTFYVKCNTGAGGESSPVLNITVAVDPTPPVMKFVDDSSTLPDEPDISWYPGKLRVKFLGEDPETKIVKYYYLLETAFTKETVVNWTPSLELNGTPIFVKANLTDGQRYVFRVKPVNLVGGEGNYSVSDGVTVDFSKAPPVCSNNERDRNETDVDCGGMCDGCALGKSCLQNSDCDSLYCADGICDTPTCSDGIQNGLESDIDCGGSCPGCGLGLACTDNIDCLSENCEYGLCAFNSCKDNILDGTESDVDCGGACAQKCGGGMNCNLESDCAEDLVCVDNTCAVPLDLDNDGVPDNVDLCPNSAPGSVVDADGCTVEERERLESPSILWTLIKWILILAVLAGAGFGGYYAYKQGYLDSVIALFKKKPVEEVFEARPAEKIPEARPSVKKPSPEDKIAALRRFAKKQETEEELDDFIPVSKLKKKKPSRSDKVFSRLKSVKEDKQNNNKYAKKKRKKKASKEDAVEKLRKIKRKK